MIVFDLKCAQHGHVFEAWFASSDAFDDQRGRGLLLCPICGDAEIAKAAMAAAVPRKGNTGSTEPVSPVAAANDDDAKAMLAALAQAQAKILSGSEWVGRDFDRLARAMDAGDAERATIHGEVTGQEARALIDDGIAVSALPFPVVPPQKRN